MNQHTISPEQSSDDDRESEFASLLVDAFDSPPLPASLMLKIDRGMEAQWGHSPGLVNQRSRNFVDAVSSGARRLRSWPIASVVAATIVLFIFVFGGSKSYAWAAMLEAIANQPAFQIGAEVLTDPAAEQNKSSSESERTQRFVKRILQQSVATQTISLDGLRIIEQDWQRVTDGVLLNVNMQNAIGQPLRLRLILDPETALPKTIQLLDQAVASEPLTVTFPTSVEKLSQVVAEVDGITEKQSISRVAPSSANLPVTESNSEARLPVGETTKWQPVTVVPRGDDSVLGKVDQTLAALWREHDIRPVPPASEAELLRRIYLDLAGRTPTVTEVRHYLTNTDVNRYPQLVAKLLASADHASHLATTWRTALIPEGVDLTVFGGREAFDRWLAERLEAGDAYDSIVRKLLLAEGRLSTSGPLLFYSAAKLDPDRLAAQTSRVFLGIRLECAQCHDHPFEPWKQTDFWSYAAFFARISRPQAELASVSTVMQVRDVDHGDVTLPESTQVVPPRLLGEGASELELDPTVVRRQQLADWLTSPKNPYFARATVNRLWSLLFGRGIVDPVDDFGNRNPPISPELLDTLASQLIESKFNLRRVLSTIALSRAYRLSSAASANDNVDESQKRLRHFAQMELKSLTAPQLYDCITVATLLQQAGASSNMAFQLNRFGNTGRAVFLQQFASPVDNRIEYMAGIPQALTLMNGELIDSATGMATSGLLKSLEAPFFTNDQRVEILFLATLSRQPTDSEWPMLRDAVPQNVSLTDRNEALADILWALLNSAEFTLNH